MIAFDRDIGFTQRVLDSLALRTRVILHNLANQNTPGFKRYEVRFEELLRDAHAAGRSGAGVRAVVARDDSGGEGVNNVSATDELATLEKVRLLEDVFSRRAAGYFKRLNKAILGR